MANSQTHEREKELGWVPGGYEATARHPAHDHIAAALLSVS
ncbi:MAG TPA: hypothetical protein VJS30_19500 [Paraburkholderia sp.]|nr:hypothetical protein [Paraburkholderia sp.]